MEKMFLEYCCEILESMRVPITASDRKKEPYPYYRANGIKDYVSVFFDDVNVEYLCFSLMFYNTVGLVNEATKQRR